MQMTPMQRMGQANEIASTALFLASDESVISPAKRCFPMAGCSRAKQSGGVTRQRRRCRRRDSALPPV